MDAKLHGREMHGHGDGWVHGEMVDKYTDRQAMGREMTARQRDE